MPFCLGNMASSQEALRFADLLNPIRDLAKNWDVDIAFHLEEYLSELEMIAITFDGGKTTMNFAQAALLIQGSACVYSKKVDFLYNLVMQLLDVLRCKKTQQVNAHHGNASQHRSLDSEQFLELDDFSFAKTTDIKPDDASVANSTSLLLPKIPVGMISHKKAADKRNIVLNTSTHEMLGKKNDFFLNSMELVRSGASVGEALDGFLDESAFFQPKIDLVESVERDRRSGSPDMVENEFPLEDGGDLPSPMDVEASAISDQVHADTKADEDRLSSNSKVFQEKFTPKTSIEKALQALKQLDPHEEDLSKRRPAIIAPRRTLRVLKTLENMGSLRPTRARAKKHKSDILKDVAFSSAFKFCDDELFSNESKFPKRSNNVPTCPSFNDKFYEEFKRRKALLQGIRGQLKNAHAGTNENEGTTNDDHDEEENLDFGADVNFDQDDDDDDDNDHEVQDHLMAAPEADNVEINNNDRTSAGESDLNSSSTFEDLIRRHTEAFIASTNEQARRSSMSKKVKLWEDSLTPVLAEEDSHSLYDMRCYSTRVLDMFVPNNRKQTMSFSKIVSGEPHYEVARLFLASLQLANNYNIDIHSEGDGVQRVNQMDITLLSHKQRSDNSFGAT